MNAMTEEQQERCEAYMRSKLDKAKMKQVREGGGGDAARPRCVAACLANERC